MAEPPARLVEDAAAEATGYEWVHAISWHAVIDRALWSAITAFLVWYFWP